MALASQDSTHRQSKTTTFYEIIKFPKNSLENPLTGLRESDIISLAPDRKYKKA
jgi:hypothetical protein